MLALVKGAGSLTESVLSKQNLFTPIYTQPKQNQRNQSNHANHPNQPGIPTILTMLKHISAHPNGPIILAQARLGCASKSTRPQKTMESFFSFLGWSPVFFPGFFFVNHSRFFLFVVSKDMKRPIPVLVSSSLSVFRVRCFIP